MRAPQTVDASLAPELQETLHAYLFFFSYRVSSDQIRYFQRALILTPDDKNHLESALNRLVSDAESMNCVQARDVQNLGYDLFVPEKGPTKKDSPARQVTFPLDQSVVSISKSLRLCAKSPTNGHIYSPDSKFCPVGGTHLYPAITTEDIETS